MAFFLREGGRSPREVEETMSTSLHLEANASPEALFASVDMGTNSFKMIIVRADHSGRFFVIDKLKDSVVLSRESSCSISAQSQLRALQSLRKFKRLILSHNVPPRQTRCVATAAVREAENRREFVESVFEDVGFHVDVLSGEDEARLIYLGVLQFLPIYENRVLTVDIGGGSTEFVIGQYGKVKFAVSLLLGHVILTQKFVKNGDEMLRMREHIRMVLEESGLVEKVRELGGFDVAVGSSGTIRAIEKAVFHGFAREIASDNEVPVGECKRDWRFNRGELRSVAERLCGGGGGGGGGEGEIIRRNGFFKRRSEFIVAGAVLLEEIFEVLDIEEMVVSGYALGEGVIAETLANVFDGNELNANARWQSVVRLATRFNSKKRMKAAAQCARIAREIFEGIRKSNELANNQVKFRVSLDAKDLECLEAACLLHNIGAFTGQKGYHKQSYHIIMNGDHLNEYSGEELKIIALLARHHRKKFPKFDHPSMNDFPNEVKLKFRFLCVIIRMSFILQQSKCVNFQEMKFSQSCQGFKLVFKELEDQFLLPGSKQPVVEIIETELMQELEHFKKSCARIW
ncbi:uncharacterized protein LOC110815309 isoform X2 [Carica papaya]|uniref:uncharacterized protein LOC110815309 isoform X2 n=1 Tax=Carica papaya TaxID=3649 RepID=UPI000B8CAF37|nr:uncharacterized protein LOC110815309 isoform X2 [Carica papaya]